MSKSLTWPQWLNVIARNITEETIYICCHIDGSYLGGDCIKNPSKTYIDAVKAPEYMSFRAKLENEINRETDAINKNISDNTSTLSIKLGYANGTGVKGRQDWLRSLKNLK